MIKRNKSRFKVKIDPNKPLPEPKQHWKKALLLNCKSNDYDEAKTEWLPSDLLDESSEGFSNVCELCGCVHLKCNFAIYNPYTEVTMKVVLPALLDLVYLKVMWIFQLEQQSSIIL